MACNKYNDLIFICDSSLQSSLFRDYLEKSLDISIKMSTIEGLPGLSIPSKSSVLIIIDNTHIDDESLDLYIKFLIEKSVSGNEVLINSPNNVAVNVIAKWPNMVGGFFCWGWHECCCQRNEEST